MTKNDKKMTTKNHDMKKWQKKTINEWQKNDKKRWHQKCWFFLLKICQLFCQLCKNGKKWPKMGGPKKAKKTQKNAIFRDFSGPPKNDDFLAIFWHFLGGGQKIAKIAKNRQKSRFLGKNRPQNAKNGHFRRNCLPHVGKFFFSAKGATNRDFAKNRDFCGSPPTFSGSRGPKSLFVAPLAGHFWEKSGVDFLQFFAKSPKIVIFLHFFAIFWGSRIEPFFGHFWAIFWVKNCLPQVGRSYVRQAICLPHVGPSYVRQAIFARFFNPPKMTYPNTHPPPHEMKIMTKSHPCQVSLEQIALTKTTNRKDRQRRKL